MSIPVIVLSLVVDQLSQRPKPSLPVTHLAQSEARAKPAGDSPGSVLCYSDNQASCSNAHSSVDLQLNHAQGHCCPLMLTSNVNSWINNAIWFHRIWPASQSKITTIITDLVGESLGERSRQILTIESSRIHELFFSPTNFTPTIVVFRKTPFFLATFYSRI